MFRHHGRRIAFQQAVFTRHCQKIGETLMGRIRPSCEEMSRLLGVPPRFVNEQATEVHHARPGQHAQQGRPEVHEVGTENVPVSDLDVIARGLIIPRLIGQDRAEKVVFVAKMTVKGCLGDPRSFRDRIHRRFRKPLIQEKLTGRNEYRLSLLEILGPSSQLPRFFLCHRIAT